MIAEHSVFRFVVLGVPAAHLVVPFGDIAMCPHIARWMLITVHDVFVPELYVYWHNLAIGRSPLCPLLRERV